MKRLILALSLSLSLTFTPQALAFQTDVQNISQDKYFQATLDAINNAQKSILVAMYYVSWDPFNKESKSRKLIQALINAHKRGVKVAVILDQTMDISTEQDETIEDWQLLKAKNVYAYQLLQREGIDVSFDSPNVNTHSKVIIIDTETVILGSSNWTETALSSNMESNLLIKSRNVAESLLNDFKTLKVQTPTIITSTSNIRISFKFLEDPKLLSKIATKIDERPLDIYLTLLRYADSKTNTATISYAKIINDLKLDRKHARTLINRSFNKLRDRYKLIDFTKEDIFRKDTVTLKAHTPARQTLHRTPHNLLYLQLG